LQDKLQDCFVVRAPSGYVARVFIAGEINYSFFLFDEELPDTTGAELKGFTLKHCEWTPVAIIQNSDNFRSIVKAVTHLLGNS
jgi:hypothetical protein